jgi:dTDP-4-dehydrorhamnose 3,5-epimerase-like enzyme
MLFEKLPRKKHVRADGWLVELVSKAYADEPFDCVHSYMVNIKPGKSRAGHYHNKKEEWFCVACGRIELVLVDRLKSITETVSLDASGEEYNIIHIPAGIAHLVKNQSHGDAAIIVFSREPEDKEDTIQYNFEERS